MKPLLQDLVYALTQSRVGEALVFFAKLSAAMDEADAALGSSRAEADSLRAKLDEMVHCNKQAHKDLAARAQLMDEYQLLAARCDEYRQRHESAVSAKILFQALCDKRGKEDADRIQVLAIQLREAQEQARNGDAELRREIAELTEEMDGHAEEVDSLADLRDALYDEREALGVRVAVVEAKLVEAEGVISAMDASHKQTLRQLAATEGLIAERDVTIANLQAYADKQAAEREALRVEAAAERAKACNLRDELKRILTERDGYYVKFANAEKDLKRERNDLAELRRAVQHRQVHACAVATRELVA